MRFRLAAVAAVAGALAALLVAGQARAAAEVHRFNLVLSGNPTQIMGGDFNDQLDYFNATRLQPRGYENFDHIQFSWLFDAELRYFARPNFAIVAGVGQLSAISKKEFLPGISQGIDLRAELLTAPIHIGGLYYLQAYNQGDFQARAYVGGGLVQYTYTKATFQQTLTNPDSALNVNWQAPGHPEYGSNYKLEYTQDAPGWYFEAGAHMFFAARYSMIVGAVYRSGEFRQMRLSRLERNGTVVPVAEPGPVVKNTKGEDYTLDMGGLGVKMAVGIGF
jgi:hypothetical protein